MDGALVKSAAPPAFAPSPSRLRQRVSRTFCAGSLL